MRIACTPGFTALPLLAALLDPGAAIAEEERDGRLLFARYCASCHGIAGEGDGPVASSLQKRVPNLRRLWRQYGTPLAVESIAQFVDGRRRITAHGEPTMPVWGRRLKDIEDAQEPPEVEIRETVRAIVVYLDGVQTRPPGTPRPHDDRSRPEAH